MVIPEVTAVSSWSDQVTEVRGLCNPILYLFVRHLLSSSLSPSPALVANAMVTHSQGSPAPVPRAACSKAGCAGGFGGGLSCRLLCPQQSLPEEFPHTVNVLIVSELGFDKFKCLYQWSACGSHSLPFFWLRREPSRSPREEGLCHLWRQTSV